MPTLNECSKQSECSLDDVPSCWIHLTEEIGELAGAIRRNTNQYDDNKITYVEREIVDVLNYVFKIANAFNIDLDSTWNVRNGYKK